MARRLAAAEKLISGLSSERERWTHDLGEIEASVGNLVGDCLLASAFLTYSGPFTFEYRRDLMQDWENRLFSKIPVTHPFSLERMLTTEVQKTEWISQGLPSDELSIQNGILATRANR